MTPNPTTQARYKRAAGEALTVAERQLLNDMERRYRRRQVKRASMLANGHPPAR